MIGDYYYVSNIPSVKTKTETNPRFFKAVPFAYRQSRTSPQDGEKKKTSYRMKSVSLTEKKDFTLIFRTGKRVYFDCVTLLIKKNKLSYSRFAFVVPVSLDKRAAERNKIRRRAREYVRKHNGASSMPFDVIFLFTKNALIQPKKHFYECLRKALSVLQ